MVKSRLTLLYLSNYFAHIIRVDFLQFLDQAFFGFHIPFFTHYFPKQILIIFRIFPELIR